MDIAPCADKTFKTQTQMQNIPHLPQRPQEAARRALAG
jgi:hypothetical protein